MMAYVNGHGLAQVENTLLKVEPMLLHVDPKGVNVEAALIEVTHPASAHLIPVSLLLGFAELNVQ